jgi:hypothetical protein
MSCLQERVVARVTHGHGDCRKSRRRREHLTVVTNPAMKDRQSIAAGLLHVGYTSASSFIESHHGGHGVTHALTRFLVHLA